MDVTMNKNKTNPYIVLAGVDGSGKSYIVNDITNRHTDIQKVAEPFRHTEATKLLADIALTDKDLPPLDRFGLFLSNRILGWSDIDKSKPIVADRSYICSIAYTIADIILKQTNEPFSDKIVITLTDRLMDITSNFSSTIPLVIDKVYLLHMSNSLMYNRFNKLDGKDITEQDVNYLFLVQKIYKIVIDRLYELGYIKSYEIVQMKDYDDAIFKSSYVVKQIETTLDI